MRARSTGMPWTALAAAVDGADAALRPAPGTGGPRDDRAHRRPDPAPRVDRVRDPDRPARGPSLLVRDVTAGEGRRPDDPVAVPVPAGPRRGPDTPAPPVERGDRTGAEPDRPRPARRSGARRVGRVAVSLEAALLMIKAGDVERGTERAREDPPGARGRGRRAAPADGGPPAAGARGARADAGAPRDRSRGSRSDTGVVSSFEGDLKRPVPARRRDARLSDSSRSRYEHRQARGGDDRDGPRGHRRRVSSGSRSRTTARGSRRLERATTCGRAGSGLASMRERVELASGTFNLRSTPGEAPSSPR